MSSKRREYHVDYCTKKAALFFVACDANPDTRVKIPDAMRIKGYSSSEATDRSLQQQVRREADKIKGDAVPGPSAPAAAAAASALITLLTTTNVGRPTLRTITVPVAVSVLPAARVAALPSPPRNKRKHRAAHAQAHARATTLVAKERVKEKENRRKTAEVIAQVEGELRARGFPVTMSKPTINQYVTLNMICTFPLARGYEGAMPHAAFELLVITAEFFIKIKGVNKDHITDGCHTNNSHTEERRRRTMRASPPHGQMPTRRGSWP